jgi:hypothetical protein
MRTKETMDIISLMRHVMLRLTGTKWAAKSYMFGFGGVITPPNPNI